MDLSTSVTNLPLVGPAYARRLEKLGIETLEDLLFHIPHRYIDYRLISVIGRVQVGETVTIQGNVDSIKNIYTKFGKRIQLTQVTDKTGSMQVVWFNQPYLVNSIRKDEKYSFSGKCDWFDRKKSLISPEYENIQDGLNTVHTARLVPVYPETARLSSKWIRGKISNLFSTSINEIKEYLPDELISKLNYPTIIDSLHYVHYPNELDQAEKGRERLAFDELLFYQLRSLYRKSDWQKIKTVHSLKVDKKILEKFKKGLPFSLTFSQERSIQEILKDVAKNYPMNRLLEGDVGSGKTVVAAAGAFAAFVNGYQSVFMAPTQILANQHFNTLKSIFDPYKVRVSLVTSEGVKKDLGKTDIFVGTHALIHKKLDFDNVALVVIDEQHRFGVEQRAHLVNKSETKRSSPHILTMTATPIPRTIALTVYGDLDLSTLTELPEGRKPITTWLVPPEKRGAAYNWIRNFIKKEVIQAFIVCPLIEESHVETMKQVKAATAEYKKLQEVFKDLNIGLLHGKQSAKEKNGTLDAFKRGELHILVSTPVVEVGIDVPNATIMIIEAAERFGLAQLHQLRGRIGRGEKKSYCLLFTESKSQKVLNRLKALKENKSGFELSELDLKLRGPGEMYGTKQHGFPELKIASWSDAGLIKMTREVAQDVVTNPQTYPKLIQKIESQNIAPN
ncbi:MAG: ATP-dependent DNA helicase RecG [Candidatus Woesebacteria bacterium GW2011_GWB1_39_10b]|uniref:ATP-dependent DNA helicase RecG n=2 Tax=Candidatus Woeseibacteriota TaxID=1752722 RepID=A0A0G0NDL6_9BACT|nr:MAG: ATP-dependent DNA helicase RecG [Microgenomates group bacterium GW2011_GWC1_38_12]KKQ94292.1 MAG: ATP-dependent DNA helicase RecG [Candidatus Woesebacteria bacterium GW2011_GWB1_39_10b]KKR14229.1 MAG: ATP-dependent DNA helicase RecG [Candidatus Woesebacteria bacterium GW2011_GWA1_39_21b]